MNINDALEKIKEELASAGVNSPVSVELSVVLHTDSKGEIEMECVHSRSRRSEHVHKLQFEVVAPKLKKKRKSEPPALPDEIKQQIPSSEPKTKSKVQAQRADYLPPYNKRDSKL